MPKLETPRQEHEAFSRWDIRSRIEDFAATQAERVLQRIRPTPDTDSLPVTVIPAPPRPGASLARLLEEEGLATPRLSNQGPGDANSISRTTVSAPPRRSQSHGGTTQPTRPSLLNSSDHNESFHEATNGHRGGSGSDAVN
ncbi:hypothetical protein O1611_g10305 [Lasiodiplodia mahajangana]|uniref:Uncharacterized protein n=1 Tax=Lasiodiplodia mahajangana TaxID=1108764 RepID=A0ACC2IZM8_9PEZI|nr:hypothetical protein O1611_g10305 [Lasiodiplodia mahajangana]